MKKNVIILGTLLTLIFPMNASAFEVGDTVYSTGNVNVRLTPDTESDLTGEMGYNAQCVIIEGPDKFDWVKIKSGDVTGYVASQYFSDVPLESGYTVAKIESQALFVREKKDIESDTIQQLAYGDTVELTKSYDDSAWVEVVTKDGSYGYVSADYVSLYTYYPTAQTISYEPVYYYDYDEETSIETVAPMELIIPIETTLEVVEEEIPVEEITEPEEEEEDDVYIEVNEETGEVIEETTTVSNNYSGVAGTANQYLGDAYVWGGSAPGGFDCSGLAQYSYAQNGISIPRVAEDQYYGGNKISVEDAVNTPGALIFYHDLGHVAISNGDGTVTHASDYGTGVITSDAYYSTPYGAVVY